MTLEDVKPCEAIDTAAAATTAYPRPSYADKFQCLAQACDENCCSGWTIPIDQQTHESYLAHPVLRPFIQELVVLNQRPTPGDVARMPLNHEGTCAFLNQEKLCGIHAHFGPGLLSNACATYPREISQPAGRSEAALNLSCPEAARLTLLDPLLLGSGPWQTFGARRYTHIPHASRLPAGFNAVLALRELVLLLLSDPTYLLWQRLHILGNLALRFEILCDGEDPGSWAVHHPSSVAGLLDEFTDVAAFHTASLPVISPNPMLQLRFTAEVLRNRLAEPPVPARFVEIVHDFQLGLACEPENLEALTDLQVAEDFSRAYRFYARPLLDRHPHLIENFLINHVFKYAYPFGRARGSTPIASPTTQHYALVANLALTQTLLVGLAAHHRERLSPEHVVRLIQSLSKTIEHRAESVAHLTSLMLQQELTAATAQAELLHLA